MNFLADLLYGGIGDEGPECYDSIDNRLRFQLNAISTIEMIILIGIMSGSSH